jgi:hypothetical protein
MTNKRHPVLGVTGKEWVMQVQKLTFVAALFAGQATALPAMAQESDGDASRADTSEDAPAADSAAGEQAEQGDSSGVAEAEFPVEEESQPEPASAGGRRN